MINRMWRNNSFVLRTSVHYAAEISVYVFQSVVSSVLFYAVVCWGGCSMQRATARLDRPVRRRAGSVWALSWSLVTGAERRRPVTLLSIQIQKTCLSPWSLDCTSTLSYGRGNKQTDRKTNAFLHLKTLMSIHAKFCRHSCFIMDLLFSLFQPFSFCTT